eukprot:4658380-Prymnesium_polylepis.1
MGARRLANQHTLRAAARVARPLLSTETGVPLRQAAADPSTDRPPRNSICSQPPSSNRAISEVCVNLTRAGRGPRHADL